MSVPVGTALAYALIPVGAMIAGGAAAAVRPPSPRWRGVIQHFAAGVVFAVVAVELLPDLRRHYDPREMAVSFGLGVAVMLGLRRLTGEGEEGEGGACRDSRRRSESPAENAPTAPMLTAYTSSSRTVPPQANGTALGRYRKRRAAAPTGRSPNGPAWRLEPPRPVRRATPTLGQSRPPASGVIGREDFSPRVSQIQPFPCP